MSAVPLAWRGRRVALPLAAVTAEGAAAAQLAMSALRRLERGFRLSAAGGPGNLVVLGDPDVLPWAEGAIYLGWDSGVLLPTTLAVHPGPTFIRAGLPVDAADLVVLLPDRVLVTRMPRGEADPVRLVAG